MAARPQTKDSECIMSLMMGFWAPAQCLEVRPWQGQGCKAIGKIPKTLSKAKRENYREHDIKWWHLNHLRTLGSDMILAEIQNFETWRTFEKYLVSSRKQNMTLGIKDGGQIPSFNGHDRTGKSSNEMGKLHCSLFDCQRDKGYVKSLIETMISPCGAAISKV